MALDDEHVLSYHDIVLKRSDVDILLRDCYLNDQIIGFYFSYLSALFNTPEILLVPPSVSFWLTNSGRPESVKDLVAPMEFFNKKLILFAVNDNEDFDGGDDGTHWSLLVYDRKMNAFIHHDSLEGVNKTYAMKLYEAVKEFVFADAESRSLPAASSKSSSKRKHKDKSKLNRKHKVEENDADPEFGDGTTPQQSNGYDCGLYVMAIARFICQWHVSSRSQGKVGNWFSALELHVTGSVVESSMRADVRRLTEDLRVQGRR